LRAGKDLGEISNQVDEIADKAQSSIREEQQQGHDELLQAREALSDCYNECHYFRRVDKLRRPADYSHQQSELVYILVCFGLESLLNASLLMEVHSFGLLGAVMLMGLISAINILFGGFVMSVIARQAHHIDPLRKALFGVLMLLLVICLLFFILLIGHFRDNMQAVLDPSPLVDPLEFYVMALTTFLESPFGLQSLQSWLLALLGLLCFGFASWQWLQRADPYPGYGKRHRRLG